MIRWPFGCLILFSACEQKTSSPTDGISINDSVEKKAFITRSFHQLEYLKAFIHNGDVITRRGNDFTSECLRSLNRRDQSFSHCGIASLENDSIFIYHALGGDFNPDQQILRDPIDDFANPQNNFATGLYRFQISDSIKAKIVSTARALYDQKVKFDMAFDLSTDDRMYCAEFVFKSINVASGRMLCFDHSQIKDFEFIGVDDIFLHPLSHLVLKIIYK